MQAQTRKEFQEKIESRACASCSNRLAIPELYSIQERGLPLVLLSCYWRCFNLRPEYRLDRWNECESDIRYANFSPPLLSQI